MSIKPRTMPGVMELLPREQVAFQRMLDTIRGGFERFGFLPVETPVMELTEVLLTKSGGDTERQVYFLQSTGALEQQQQALAAGGEPPRPELALRFDLTVPLARYVAEHEHELPFPFRRYQIQRVYRGERAQRGRFREFYQCDIDVVGKDSLPLAFDAEMPAVIAAVFTELDIGAFTIRINNRKLLRGILTALGISDPVAQTTVLREIDKTDKRGESATLEALLQHGFSAATAATLLHILYQSCSEDSRRQRQAICGENLAGGEAPLQAATDPDLMTLQGLTALIPQTWPDDLRTGAAELGEVVRLLAAMGVERSRYRIDFSIARGLDYYTGTVYETTLDAHPEIGSVCSGGRYDDLASHYTKSRLPGVGISIGATRLFWQLREAGLTGSADSTVEALVTQMDPTLMSTYLEIASQLRRGGINTEVQLEAAKLGRQLKYADRAGIRFALIVGEDEAARGAVTVKDLRRQAQFEVPRAELVEALRVELGQSRAVPA